MIWIFNIFVFIFGACIGSFLNCLAWRLYHDEGLWGRSKCPKCHEKIAWHDNVPLLSYLALGGQCRHCRQKIAIQYWLVELAVAVLFLFAFSRNFPSIGIDLLSTFYPVKSSFAGIPLFAELFHGVNFITFNSRPLWLLGRDWLLISFLVVIFIMDLRWMVVADEISLPAIVIIFILNIYLGSSWSSLLSSAIIGAGFFALQYAVSRGHWVGGGDIRLGALMGVALGWPLTVVALMLAYFSGALVGVILIVLKRKDLKSPLPFGVFLAPATLVALWWGQALYQWYMNLLF